jgi:hypothetical protein
MLYFETAGCYVSEVEAFEHDMKPESATEM